MIAGMEAKIKASLWIKAQVRMCDMAGLPVAVMKRGDPDAGTILIKLRRGETGCEVLTQVRAPDGRLGWMRGTGKSLVPENDAEAYIRRQIDRDYDLWVLEIDDFSGRYVLDGPLLD